MTRRTILSGAAAAAADAIARPCISRAADRPLIAHGIQSGDVSAESGVVWARADRPARMLVDVATTDSFRSIRQATFVDALPETDLTGKALIDNLPPGQDIFYRIRFQDLAEPALFGEAAVGRFRTAPADCRSVSFLWSGDTAGQGWGIDESRGGMRTYATMLNQRADFFIHCGDNIYADCIIPPQLPLASGEIWRNLVTPEKSKPAETLDEFRGNYKYNLADSNLRAFNAAVPTFALWDNHEVMEDWWPDKPLRSRDYATTSALLLSARARRAFHEYMPMRETMTEPGRIYRKIAYGPLLDVFLLDLRSYRGQSARHHDASDGPDAQLLGPAQLAWLKRELKRSRAVWKVIATATPIGMLEEKALVMPVGPSRGSAREIAGLLSFIQHAGIANTIWIAADLHYTAAHRYDPARALFRDFEPFWEFVSGPIHAGTWRPCALAPTFGPQVVFSKGSDAERGDNLAPCYGLQFFGQVRIDGATGVMTVALKDVAGSTLWSIDLEPSARLHEAGCLMVSS